MKGYLPPGIWDEFRDDLYGATARVMLQIFLAGGASGLKLLPERIAILENWDVFSRAAQEYLKIYRLSTVPQLTETTRNRAINIINDWIQSGEKLDMLTTRLEPWLGSARAGRIAVTEVTRTYASGNIAAWQATGLVGGKRWSTANDELVCFPAGTMITSLSGARPIEKIRPGNYVLTSSSRFCKVIATRERPYSGEMTLLLSGEGLLLCTSNHPIWHIKKGWLDAGNLKPGDAIQSVDNKPRRVIAVCNFPLADSNHNPTIARKILRLAQIAGRVLMPVITVNLKCDPLIREKKVNGVTPNLSFLDKLYARSLKNDTNRLFKKCLRSAFPVTREGTELPVGITGAYSNFLSASGAVHVYRGAAALLRTIVPIQSLFGNKNLTAPFALGVLGFRDTAGAGTNGIPISDRRINSEAFSAYRTRLSNSTCFSVDLVTHPRTESLAAIDTGGSRQVGLPALLTNNLYSSDGTGVVTGARTKRMPVITSLHSLVGFPAKLTSVFKRHGKQLLTTLQQLYHALGGNTTVYNIQVENDPTYYANGILVHNCPICGPLNGKLVDLEGNFKVDPPEGNGGIFDEEDFLFFGPPAHVNCRCWLTPAVDEKLVRAKMQQDLEE